MEDIFDGKMPPVPAGTDALYALTASMVSYAGKCADDLTKIANSIRYADRMPPDFSALLMKDYMYLKDGYRGKTDDDTRIPQMAAGERQAYL